MCKDMKFSAAICYIYVTITITGTIIIQSRKQKRIRTLLSVSSFLPHSENSSTRREHREEKRREEKRREEKRRDPTNAVRDLEISRSIWSTLVFTLKPLTTDIRSTFPLSLFYRHRIKKRNNGLLLKRELHHSSVVDPVRNSKAELFK